MPTVLRVGSFRFHFYSDERNEPPHIHVRTPTGECKFWLEEVRLVGNWGVRPNDLRTITALIFQHRELLFSRFRDVHSGT